MRIWSRPSQPGDRQPTVTSRRGAMTDEAFDDLARAAGETTGRRSALKVLLLGVASAAVGGYAVKANTSGLPGLPASAAWRQATAQTAGITTCNAVIAAQCCTDGQLQACEKDTYHVFAAAAKQCAPQCRKNKRSAACKSCADAAAAKTVSSYQSCVGDCATAARHEASVLLTSVSVPASASLRRHPSRQSSPTSLVARYSADQASAGPYCDDSALLACVAGKFDDFEDCMRAAVAGCIFSPVGCLTAAAVCMTNFTSGTDKCEEKSHCPSDTICTIANVCCAAGYLGCPCESGAATGCCIDPATDDYNCGGCGNDCTARGMTCTNGVCTCGGENCNFGTCCGFTCTDINTDPDNCGACGSICPDGTTCVAGECTDCASSESSSC